MLKLTGNYILIEEKMSLNFRSVQFLTSATKVSECPTDLGSEVVFCGRSNAGKSSAINALTGNRSLAKTSKTPGRTQMINFFLSLTKSESSICLVMVTLKFRQQPRRLGEKT